MGNNGSLPDRANPMLIGKGDVARLGDHVSIRFMLDQGYLRVSECNELN